MIERLKEIFLEIIPIEGLSCNERAMSSYIKNFLSKNNYEFTEDNSSQHSHSNTGNIICKVGSGGDFILTAHMDTARSTEKVQPVLKDDRIESDGTTVLGVDNRAGIAILLYLLEKIRKENIQTKDFSVGFTTCEETTLAGSKNFVLNGATKFCFVFDSYLRPGYFINESYGAASFNIQIKGKAAHSGIEPESGINSLQIAAQAISKLQLGLYNDETTLNIGKFSGGSSINVIPDLVHLEGEIRSIEIKNIEKCFAEVLNTFNGVSVFWTVYKFGVLIFAGLVCFTMSTSGDDRPPNRDGFAGFN